ncbi:MAG: hypothetical protein B6U78_01010 [Candidatus Aenigmarchaeota archaeon ex4484_224]|nr:MAG: hypothetical protein B6U78_01010 [Candidatus Aenigmarchaeota archaeon ex4484_224]
MILLALLECLKDKNKNQTLRTKNGKLKVYRGKLINFFMKEEIAIVQKTIVNLSNLDKVPLYFILPKKKVEQCTIMIMTP